MDGGGSQSSLQGLGQRVADRQGAKRRAGASRRLQVAAQPAGRHSGAISYAALHRFHRLEVGAGLVRRSDRVDDRQTSGAVDVMERRHDRVEGVERVEGDPPLRRGHPRVIRARNGEAGPVAVIVRVTVRRHQGQPVGAAAQEDADEHVARRTYFRLEQQTASHGPIRHGVMPQAEQAAAGESCGRGHLHCSTFAGGTPAPPGGLPPLEAG